MYISQSGGRKAKETESGGQTERERQRGMDFTHNSILSYSVIPFSHNEVGV